MARAAILGFYVPTSAPNLSWNTPPLIFQGEEKTVPLLNADDNEGPPITRNQQRIFTFLSVLVEKQGGKLKLAYITYSSEVKVNVIFNVKALLVQTFLFYILWGKACIFGINVLGNLVQN